MQKGEGILSRKEKSWAYSKWCDGRTICEIAEALHVSTKTVTRAINGRPRIRSILVYDGKVGSESMSVKYACDRCGKIITGSRGYLSWCYRNEDGDLTENVLEAKDYCEGCMKQIRKYIDGAPEPETVERPEKVEKVKPDNGKRIHWDDGKIRALLAAGWSVQAIADELRVKPNTLYHHISILKQEGKI